MEAAEGDKAMSDVNPLGPMMHLNELEREALALRAATMKDRPSLLNTASAWLMRLLERLSISPKGVSAGDSAHVGRR